MSAPSGGRVVLASAGTGKTWALTTHYLALLTSGVAPERCLATTFTRKAAREILGRVFERLVAAARRETARAELDAAIGGGVPTRERAADLVAELARCVERCRVRTLDAFFVEVARALAAELGLAADWTIADEFRERRARDAAIGRALEGGGTGAWVPLLRELVRERATRAVHETLVETVEAAHGLYLDAPARAWSALRIPARLADDDLARLDARLAALPLPSTAKGAPDQRWRKEVERARRRLAARDWVEFGKSGIAAKLIDGATEYCDHEIDTQVAELWRALIVEAAADQGGLVAGQNRATRILAERFDRELAELLDERGLVRFGDLPRWLARAERTADLGELAWRLDAELDHLLLDEFQDTSPAQWRVLAPFAAELAADGGGGRSFFCVGDGKQSIYGWRGGDPRLLAQVADWPTVRRDSLNESRRSAQVVLDVVNAVFGGLRASAVIAAKPERAPAAELFRFEEHRAHDRGLPGAVRASFVELPDGTGADEVRRACTRATVARVAELVRRLPEIEIGVLVRRKARVGPLVHRLRQLGLGASADSGNPLTDARLVQAALSALHFAEHPGDGAARFHVAHSPLAAAAGLGPETDETGAAPAARELRRSVVERGFAATLERFRATLGDPGAFEGRRFDRLIELAIAWDGEPALAIDDFVARVRETRVEDASSARIKVMTIHAAKGLEFDAVLLPDLAHDFEKQMPELVWRRTGDDPAREIEALSWGSTAAVRGVLRFAGDPLLGELYGATRTRSFYDELCTLYVALTRARRHVELLLPPVPVERPPFSGAALISHALGLAGTPAGAPDRLAPGSDLDWSLARGPAPETATRAPPARRAPIAFGRGVSTGGPLPPSDEPASRPTPLRVLLADAAGARLRGSRLHAWLEQVEWLESFGASDAELCELARARDLDGAGLERDLADFRRLLATGAARRVLGRPAGAWELWRERRYLLPLADGEVERGAFDRVLVDRVGGRARVVDFKSDAGLDGEDALAARVAHHAPQLCAYRAALARILGLEPRAIEAEIWFLEADAVRAVE